MVVIIRPPVLTAYQAVRFGVKNGPPSGNPQPRHNRVVHPLSPLSLHGAVQSFRMRALIRGIGGKPRSGDSLMLIVMERDCSAEQIQKVIQKIEVMGLKAHPIPGEVRTAIGITGNAAPIDPAEFETLPGVEEAIP